MYEQAEADRKAKVSLFTREWIEILVLQTIPARYRRLPLYEGVD